MYRRFGRAPGDADFFLNAIDDLLGRDLREQEAG